jgi:hypothetical protein
MDTGKAMIITELANCRRLDLPRTLFGFLLIVCFSGCQPFGATSSLSPELLELRSQWLTSSQPEGPALGVIETRQQLTRTVETNSSGAFVSRSESAATQPLEAAPQDTAAGGAMSGDDEPAETLVAESRPPRLVTVTGAIQAGRFEPWQTNQAAFVITDLDLARPTADHGGADHDPSTCPFCKRRQQDPLLSTAWVQCLDAEGNVVAIDARKLFGLKENQVVVVQGNAHIDATNRLVITVDQLFAAP